MGKPGKKAGKGMLPPTNPKRQADSSKSHLRDQRTIKRLKMYTTKIKRDEKGTIIEGSVLSASDRVEKSMARIAPDRRWFGNTRTIGQEALQKFREEMGAKMRDPYSVVIKQSKLPLSLLEEPKMKAGGAPPRQEMQFADTFGDKARRKRVQLKSATVQQLAAKVESSNTEYDANKDKKDQALIRARLAETGERLDRTANQKLFRKGQSNRIWNELYKVVDSADVILYVLDARDPMGTRSPFLEEYMRKEKKYKHFVFVLNKCDLIPLWATARWMQVLSKDFPTVAFHASINHPFGKGNLISLLRQFSRLHNVTHRGNKRTKTPISVGIVGYPNVGKSSIINTLRRKAVCKVAPIPGETKVWQYVALTRSIFVIDCPGIVYDKEGNNDVQAVLKGVVRIERLGAADKTDVVHTVLQIVKPKDLTATYGVQSWRDANDFLEQLATMRGKLHGGGVPDTDSVARSVLYDWQRGKIPWFSAPPFESNQQYRETLQMPNAQLLKVVEHYNTFNVVDDRIENGPPAEGNADDSSDDDGEAAGSESGDAPSEGDPDTVTVHGKNKKRSRKLAKVAATSAASAPSALDTEVDPEATIMSFITKREEETAKQELRNRRNAQRKSRATIAVAPGADGLAAKRKKGEGAHDDGEGSSKAVEEDALWAQFMAAAQQ